MRSPKVSLFLLATILWSSATCGKALSQFVGPLQLRTSDNTIKPIVNETLERHTHPYLGDIQEITVLRYADEALPDDGDKWIYEIQDEQGRAVASLELTYSADTNCLVAGTSPVVCNFSLLPGEYGWKAHRIDFWWDFSCADTAGYSLSVTEPATTSTSFAFHPSRFRPKVYYVNIEPTIQPLLPGDSFGSQPTKRIEAGVSPVMTLISDDAGCLRALAGVSVRLKMNVDNGSGAASHTHFTSEDEPGTGTFVTANGAGLDDRAINAQGTEIEGETDEYGAVRAHYKGGIFGVPERLTATARIEELSPQDPAAEVQAQAETHIRVSGLRQLPEQGENHSFNFTPSNPCKHSPSPTWLTDTTAQKVSALARIYRDSYGVQISYNDASLPYGGFFDRESRTNRCHTSHRRGIDIDVNSGDLAGTKLRTHREEDGRTRLLHLDDIARLLGFERIIEKASIHYRDKVYQLAWYTY